MALNCIAGFEGVKVAWFRHGEDNVVAGVSM